MDALTITPAVLAKRRLIAERLLRLEKKVADDLLKIDEEKDALRALSEEAKAGFNIEIPGLGTVEVKAGRPAEVTGTSPALIVAAFLRLTKGRREKLVKDGLVEIVDVVKRAAKPSVTVRL